MKRIVYLLHRFPGITDTFIQREIRSLRKAGTNLEIISVWKPPHANCVTDFFATSGGKNGRIVGLPVHAVV